MKVATIIMLVLAIVASSVALVFAINSVQSPLAPTVRPTGSSTIQMSSRERLSSISDHHLEIGTVPLVSTIEDGIYRLNDYSEFYAASDGGFAKINNVRTTSVTVLVSGEVCDIDIRYVESNGRIVGGGNYERIIEQNGVYSTKLNLRYTLTEMPSALMGQENEKLLLVGYAADEYYSEAFAISLDGGYSRNLLARSGREDSGSDGHVILTDELVKNSGEYLYFFSSRLYDKDAEGAKFNPYKSVDLFRTRAGETELVARQAHHRYLGFMEDGTLRLIRSEYATLRYTVGSVPMVNFEEMGFSVISLDPIELTQVSVMRSDEPYSSSYRRFENRLVRISQDNYGVLEVYDMRNGSRSEYGGMKIRSVSVFDVSDGGRYIVAGGYTSSVSTVNQCIHLIDTSKKITADISGKELFLTLDGNFEFIGSGNLINSSYDGNEKITLYITRVNKIFKAFTEGGEG
ncbi:MAG: hypothetical protein IKY44_05185 [Clostridia bacterium]|nr:hypothetical protein [Clostridia bacterium]